MNFKTNITTLFASVVLLCYQQSFAADMHTVLVLDTFDESIGDSVEKDMVNYQEFLDKVAQYTDLNIVETVFAGDAFISENVFNHVKNLDVKSDDVVVFYYSGHGYRKHSKSTQWPAMHFGFDQLGLDLQDVAQAVLEKHPRFVLVMSDTCNNYYEDDSWAPDYERSFLERAPNDKTIRAGYRHLFLDDDLLVMTTSAKPGEYAYGTSRGGVYTNAFLKSFYSEVKLKNPSWQHLLGQTQKAVKRTETSLYDVISLDELGLGE